MHTKEKNSLAMLFRHAVENQCGDFDLGFRDLLADIRHLADEMGIDFEQQLKASYDVYCEEKQG